MPLAVARRCSVWTPLGVPPAPWGYLHVITMKENGKPSSSVILGTFQVLVVSGYSVRQGRSRRWSALQNISWGYALFEPLLLPSRPLVLSSQAPKYPAECGPIEFRDSNAALVPASKHAGYF